MAAQDFWMPKISGSLKEKAAGTDNEVFHPVIIEFVGGANRVVAKIVENQGRIYREIRMIPSIAAELPLKALAALSKTTGVVRIWEDTEVSARLDQVVPHLGVNWVWEGGYTGKGVVVAVLDTGIFPHVDLTTPENRILAWHDLLQHRPNPYDDNGHGTHIAGVIAGNGASSGGRYRGIAPEARLVGVKVLNQDGKGRLSDLIAGLEWCLSHLATLNIKVINLSLGTPAQAGYPMDLICRVTAKAVRQGVTVCASLVNGINPNIIAIGNYDGQKTFSGDEIINDQNAETQFYAAKPDLVAPGTEITSLKVGGDYWTLSGTSVATPLVSGAVALVLQKWPNLRPERVKWLLTKNAQDLGIGVNLQGAGLLNLDTIFAITRKKPKKSEIPQGPDELLKVLLGLIGQNTPSPNLNGELLKNVIVSLMKGFGK